MWGIIHPELPGGFIKALHTDIVVLDQHGFLAVSNKGDAELTFSISPEGFEYCDARISTKIGKILRNIKKEYDEAPIKTVGAAISILLIIGAFVGSYYGFFLPMNNSKSANDSISPIINTPPTGDMIVPPVNAHSDARKIQININQMNNGSIELGPESDYIKHSNETKLELQMNGVIDDLNLGRFAIVSSGDGLYLVHRLYIKLHGYEKCGLRNESPLILGPFAVIPYSFYISPEYSEYDIIPIDHPGNIGSWVYKGESFDDFLVEFESEPYTLYVISIELEASDMKNNKEVKISSPLYKLMKVQKGDYGGCLNLKSWYNPEDLATPKDARYIDKFSTLQYQLLILNMYSYNYYDYLSKLDRRQLVAIVPQLEEIASKRKDNTIFQRNIKLIVDYLNQTSHNQTFQYPLVVPPAPAPIL